MLEKVAMEGPSKVKKQIFVNEDEEVHKNSQRKFTKHLQQKFTNNVHKKTFQNEVSITTKFLVYHMSIPWLKIGPEAQLSASKRIVLFSTLKSVIKHFLF